ncbi:hypothetical protein AA637_05190 [Cyanobacterium sp. HL-69]|uniref:hypothetical protein n=1 Tax=unclassified Cyanobacterium TaxID=2629879 RepID=UPI0008526BEF|nr:hypothetical protein [Cyanobacterium sp. IPPAS B-1200]AUC60588.1 hypothetical protein AA637_05190 [Cyanobacterium sp. HL-69]OEJ77971.1 hypothetical protein A5482_03915 [Cyanobacterium sp. IPPAS B-1200]
MNANQIFKTLVLSTPLVIASIFVSFGESSSSVKAQEIRFRSSVERSVFTTQENAPVEYPNLEKNEFGDYIMNFTDEESDEAVRLFGCDCVSSINAVRKMRGMTTTAEGTPLNPDTRIAACPHRQFFGV